MKYIITAKCVRDGNDHVTDPLRRTEICTEMIITRLKLIELLNTGLVSRGDCIVTRVDRSCLYENLFDKVIDWQEFVKKANSIDANDVVDLVADIYNLDMMMPFHPFYERFHQDYNEIFNIKLSEFNKGISTPYICLLVRKTPNHKEKNLTDEFWLDFIYEFLALTFYKIKIFVFGQNADQIQPHKNVIFIDKFQDWCTILSYDACKCIVSTTSGGVYPVFFTGHEKSKLFIIDNNRLIEKHGDSPSFYNPCINFRGVKIEKVQQVPPSGELAKTIVKYAEV